MLDDRPQAKLIEGRRFAAAPLTNADTMPAIRPVGAAMSAFTAGKSFIVPGFFGGPSETRTPDPLIKSQLLYQLS